MMKNVKPGQLMSLLLLLFVTACKEELSLPAPARELNVRVVNSKNEPVPNAEVRIYTTAQDWKSEDNAIAQGVTDGSGSVDFSDIGTDSLWMKATWIDFTSKEVFQNTLVSYEPTSPLPGNSKAFYQIKVNSAKVLKGIRIKEAEYNSQGSSGSCLSGQSIYYCGYRRDISDESGPGCDLYLMIDKTLSSYSDNVESYFYRSAVKADITADIVNFEVNDTITDFGKPYFIGVREHLIVSPESYMAITCSNSYYTSSYASLGEYLASVEGQEYVFNSLDRYIHGKVPLLNAENSTMPPYPAEELTIKLSKYSNQTLKLQLEWIYE